MRSDRAASAARTCACVRRVRIYADLCQLYGQGRTAGGGEAEADRGGIGDVPAARIEAMRFAHIRLLEAY